MLQNRYFNYAATAQLVIDPVHDQLLAANQEACRMLAMSAAELQAMPVSELFKPSFPELLVFTQELIETGRGWTDVISVLRKGEAERVEMSGRCAAAGDELYVYVSFHLVKDIDRLRGQSDAQHHYDSGLAHWQRVARVFQEFERQNALLLDAAGEGIYGVDALGNTTFVNPAAERILGYAASDLAGRNMHSTVHHSHADGSHYDIESCPIFAALKDGGVHHVEHDIFWSKHGKPIDVEYTSTPIIEHGEVMGAVVVFRDVTQRKQDQKRLLDALNEVEELKNRLEMENAYLQDVINSEFNHHQIIGKSPAIQTVLQQIGMVAPTDATVLIHGESGTGKELIARAIHDESQRSGRSLIRVNCAAIPEELFESEFFGHIKGAFTGATHDRAGRFELANGGTLFLDEVGEIPLHLQGKLLRVLQEQQFERIGEEKTREVDVRIIAATNRDLKQQVDAGQFREDLYFRLNVFPIESVPLRKRAEDIPQLTQHFLEKASVRAGKSGLKIPLGELQKLEQYDWPGNIRELENVIERQVILAQGDCVRFAGLQAAALPEDLASPVSELAVNQVLTEADKKELERRNILRALEQCEGKIFGANGAAELLGLKPTTLASRIDKFKIDARAFKPSRVGRAGGAL
ncbi:MAG: sigma 54-interacting transcriptional regulator [Oleiphilaceae bacterium]|nr:sigma 54-interacting transcriptional regulator [Oleiphilaceae bacterium]